MKKISVIVPVYKTEKLLDRCIQSIINQVKISIDEYEVIIVNDGTPDNAQLIIDHYVDKYPGFIYGLKKKNGGLPSARNYGVQMACGEYICFIDSDDFIEEDMFYELYKKGKENQADVVRGNFQNHYLNGKIEKNPYFINIENSMTGKQYYYKEVTRLRENMKNMVWMSLYHRSIFFDAGIFFDEHPRIFEDILFNAKVMQYAKKVVTVDKALYNYIQYNQSITNNLVIDKSQQAFLDLAMKLSDLASERDGERFLNATHDYAIYVAIFGLKITGLKAILHKSYMSKMRKYKFKNETAWRSTLLKFSPAVFSWYLWIVEYMQRIKKRIRG